MSESLASLYAATYAALRAEYPRLAPDDASTLAAQICKAGIPYRAPDGRIAFNDDARALAPRLVAPTTVAANASERDKLRAARDWAARAADLPPPRLPATTTPTTTPVAAPVASVSGGATPRAVLDAEAAEWRDRASALAAKIGGTL